MSHEKNTIEPLAVALLLDCHDQTTSNTRVLVRVSAGSRRESMSIQTNQPSDYAPTKADPIRLASATILAVDRIGAATSEEIEKTADEIMRGATEIVQKLQELATAIREHSKIANGHVATFCEKATSVFDGIRDLQEKLEGDHDEPARTEIEEILPMPVFLKNGPAAFEDQSVKDDKTNGAATGIRDFSFQRRL
jgi:hypothetical protein